LNFPASHFAGETLDLDQDGVSNLKEVISGINPFGTGSLITSKNQFNVDENSINIGKVELIPATTETTFSFTLLGTDSVHASIDSTGQLTFRAAPNYDQPADNNQDNVYEITVRIDDGSRTIDQPIVVTIIDSHDLELAFDIKQLLFTWGAWPDTSYYKLIKYSPDNQNGRQIGNDIYATEYRSYIGSHLYDWNNTTYSLEAYNSNFVRIIESIKIPSVSGIPNTIGHFENPAAPLSTSFGYSVSISETGQTLAVGAIGEDSVYVFSKKYRSSPWSNPIKLQAANTEPGDYFGQSVSLSANGLILAVGARYESGKATALTHVIPDINGDDESQPQAGAVYIFEYDSVRNNWSQTAYLKALNAERNDSFGHVVEFGRDGKMLAVGAPGEDGKATRYYNKESMPELISAGSSDDNSEPASGAVYIFTQDNISNRWSQQTYIKARNAESGDSFGTDISVSAGNNTPGGDYLLMVGARNEDGRFDSTKAIPDLTIAGNVDDNSQLDAGAVYGYRGNPFGMEGWFLISYIKASNAESGDNFGSKVALNNYGTYLAVSAPLEKASASKNTQSIPLSDNDNDTLIQAGAVYAFSLNYNNSRPLTQEAYLKALNATNFALFGSSLSISRDGNIITIGAPGEAEKAISLLDPMPDLTDGSVSTRPFGASGAAYIFTREIDLGVWRQSAYLKASKSMNGGGYGSSLALGRNGASLVVGAPNQPDLNSTDEFPPEVGGAYLY